MGDSPELSTPTQIITFCRVKPNLSNKHPSCTFAQSIGIPSSKKAGSNNGDDADGNNNLPNTLRVALPASYVHTTHNLDSDPVFEFPSKGGLLPDDQGEIFKRTARPAVDTAFNGYNSCIFAYGQTGSGKTYTMTGGETFNERGLIPRVLSYVFSRVKKANVFVSYLEIYNEAAYDILDKSKGSKTLEQWSKVTIQDDEMGEAQMTNLRVFECVSEEQALSLLFLGNSNRITSATKMNLASSRSHAIFTLSITSSSGAKVSTGKIHIVDLAGSERSSKAHLDLVDSFALGDSFADNIGGVNLSTKTSTSAVGSFRGGGGAIEKDGTRINLSLHFLQQVILSLQQKSAKKKKGPGGGGRGDNEKEPHIPYRNSVMTTILKDSLGGNAQAIFIATINPESVHIAETLSTLRFMMRCSQVETSLKANIFSREETISNDIDVLQREVLELRREVKRKEKEKQAFVKSKNRGQLGGKGDKKNNGGGRKKKDGSAAGGGAEGGDTRGRKRLVLPSLAKEELDVLVSKFLTRQSSSEKIFFDILLAESDTDDNVVYLASKLRSECERVAAIANAHNIDLKANKERYKQSVVEIRTLKSENALLMEKITSLEEMFVNFNGAYKQPEGGAGAGAGRESAETGSNGGQHGSKNGNNSAALDASFNSSQSGNPFDHFDSPAKEGQDNGSASKQVCLSSNTDTDNAYEQMLIDGHYFLVRRKRRLSKNKSKQVFFFFTHDLSTLVWKSLREADKVKGSRNVTKLTKVVTNKDCSNITLVGRDKESDSITLEMSTDDTLEDMNNWAKAFAFALQSSSSKEAN